MMHAPGPSLLDGSLRLPDGTHVEGQWLRGKRIGVGASGEVYSMRDEAHGFECAAEPITLISGSHAGCMRGLLRA